MDQTVQMLIILLVGFFVILLFLVFLYLFLKMRENSKKENKSKSVATKVTNTEPKTNGMGKQSIFNFMEFDKIEDNMIFQKNGKKFVMVIECQGINYDLMSGLEKNGVEEGFVQFLNTLRSPIQIYVQTRTVNLESSINSYKERINKIESDLFRMRQDYQEMVESQAYTQEELDRVFMEVTKQTNLYEYGKDVIYDTEKMSLNKNILNKKYYIIISHYPLEEGKDNYDKSEIQSEAFSELYINAQSIIRAISACGVNGKILNSMELSELMYVAYNRDESETFDLKKALMGNYDRLYSTAPDVLEKKMKEIDKIVEEKATASVIEKVEKFKSKYREKAEKKEESIEDLADEMAKLILEENRAYLGDEIVDGILEEEKGGKANVKKEKSTTRTRTKKQ